MSMSISDNDSIFDALSAGIITELNSIKGVQDIKCDLPNPVTKTDLNEWERKYSINLPQDLKNFYLSLDGLTITWNYDYSGEIMQIGLMHINKLSELQPLITRPMKGILKSELVDLEILRTNSLEPTFNNPKCKIFKLDDTSPYMATVCLVIMNEVPSIWLLDKSFEWHKLSGSFIQYYRMMLIYRGLPEWHYQLTPIGISSWSKQIMNIFLPKLNITIDSLPEEKRLDPTLFTVTENIAAKKSARKIKSGFKNLE